ncbi:MAG: Clp1/GlmU family protein [Anaerolineae bacterium]
MADIVVPPYWMRLAAEDLCGTVMVIGAPDTGKSTLAVHLYQSLCRRGRRTAYLDADVGQSILGLPTTLNVALAQEPGDPSFPPQGARAAFFVGAVTPRGHMLPTVIGSYRLQQKAFELGAEVIVLDTTGLVDSSHGGKALKQWKIELLTPGVVIGLQQGRELEPILWPLRRDGRVRCVELSVSSHVAVRSREARIARRREGLARYFRGARPHRVVLQQMAVYDLERLASSALLAFQDGEGLVLGLGVVEEIVQPAATIVVRTPLADLEGVMSVRFGAARWDLLGQREIRVL